MKEEMTKFVPVYNDVITSLSYQINSKKALYILASFDRFIEINNLYLDIRRISFKWLNPEDLFEKVKRLKTLVRRLVDDGFRNVKFIGIGLVEELNTLNKLIAKLLEVIADMVCVSKQYNKLMIPSDSMRVYNGNQRYMKL